MPFAKTCYMITKKDLCKLIFILLLLVCNFSFAQSDFRFGLKAGISIPNLQSSGDNPLSSGWSSRQGPYIGVVTDLRLDKNLYVQAELNYSSQGGKKDGVQAIPVSPEYASFFPEGVPVPAYLYSSYSSEAKLNYLELPLMLKYEYPFSQKFSVFVNGGPYVGYLLSAKNVTSGTDNIYLDKTLTMPLLPAPVSFDANTDIKSDLTSFNVGVQAGIGFAYSLGTAGRLILTGGGNYGLTHIQVDPANGQNNTGAATITVGYLVNL